MQGKRLVVASALGLTCLFASTSYADCYSAPYGWYLELNVGEARIINANYPGFSSSANGLGVNANLGYKFMAYFAAEIGYTRYKDATIKDQFGVQAATVTPSAYDITGKGIVPFPQAGLELFGKLGVVRAQARLSISNSTAAAHVGINGNTRSSTSALIGIGIQYYFMPELAIVAQWQRANSDNQTGILDLYSIGLSFIFD